MVMTAVPLPDPDVVSRVLLLVDALDAERARRPPSPMVVDPSKSELPPESVEMARLREFLAALGNDHQAQIDALFWIGRDPLARAEHYSSLYDYALTTDPGKVGASYLAGKTPLGECLRRGLGKLGLGSDRARPVEARDYSFHLKEPSHA
jgi:hypothetical protein